MQFTREGQGVQHIAEGIDRPGLARQAPDLRVQEADVEGRVVDDQFGALHEGHELVRNLGKARLPLQPRPAQAVHGLGAFVDVAVGVEVTVEASPRGASAHELDAPDFDDPVPSFDFEAGGFSVEDDLPHGRGF